MKYLFFFLCALILVANSSCKKVCYECSARCYVCQSNPDTLCNVDFFTDQLFDTIIQVHIRSGKNCWQVTNVKNQEICDKPSIANNLKSVFESQRYTCIEK